MEQITFLTDKREVSSDWHLFQANTWLKFDNKRYLGNVLVYASVELRCAIERYFFELLVTLKNGKLTDKELERCKSKIGLLEFIKEVEPNYRKRAEFTNLIASVASYYPSIIVIDFKYLINLWHKLSAYMHMKLEPAETWDSVEFVKEGFKLIDKALNTFDKWHRDRNFGIADASSFPPEVTDVYHKYLNSEIDDKKAKGMLLIMQPVLEQRFLQGKLPNK